MSKKPYGYAILEGVAQEMRANPKLCVNFGQGDYTATSLTGNILNLNKEFPFPRTLPRHMNPIDEGWYAGWCNGMSAAGFSTLARFPNMAGLIATEYVYNNIAKLHYMSGGSIGQNVTLWMDGSNRRIGQAGQHTETGQESIYAFMAGLKVVCPSTVYDAKGLMITALRDPDPVIFYDYSRAAGGESAADVPDEAYEVPIGKAIVRQEGKDITIIAWAPTTVEVMNALPVLAKAGISVEFVDPRTIKPLDTETLVASVKKTGRCLVVDQASYTNSYSSHVLAEVAQNVRGALLKKICFPDAPGPGAREMIEWMTPDAPKIIDAVKQMVKL